MRKTQKSNGGSPNVMVINTKNMNSILTAVIVLLTSCAGELDLSRFREHYSYNLRVTFKSGKVDTIRYTTFERVDLGYDTPKLTRFGKLYRGNTLIADQVKYFSEIENYEN